MRLSEEMTKYAATQAEIPASWVRRVLLLETQAEVLKRIKSLTDIMDKRMHPDFIPELDGED